MIMALSAATGVSALLLVATLTSTASGACPSGKESGLDLLIYMDNQDYISKHFGQQLAFVKDFVAKYDMGGKLGLGGKSRISVHQFGIQALKGSTLPLPSLEPRFASWGRGFQYSTKDLLEILDNFNQRKSGKIHSFWILHKYFFYIHGSRDPKVFMFLTGGKSENLEATKRYAKMFHEFQQRDMRTIVVKVGDDIEEAAIQAIAGDKYDNIFKMDDSKAAEKITKLLHSWSCKQ